jgi:glycosyltransferase involved in cell wall biosynthesis
MDSEMNMNAMPPLVSIIVPHYQTPELVKLCLRSIRKFTTGIPYEVIVVDNASRGEASLKYLRSVDWIRLIERTGEISTGSNAHREAVEIGFDAARAPFVLTIHTDTIPVRNDWLQFHLDPLLADERIAAVGTDKLVLRSRLQQWMRSLETMVMWWKRFRQIRAMNKLPYIRSHCALYRRSLLDKHRIRYNDIPTMTAGHGVHHELERLGYQCRLLDPRDVIERVVHLNHATELLLPELHAQCRGLHLWRGQRRIIRFFQREEIQNILDDASLDHATDVSARAA